MVAKRDGAAQARPAWRACLLRHVCAVRSEGGQRASGLRSAVALCRVRMRSPRATHTPSPAAPPGPLFDLRLASLPGPSTISVPASRLGVPHAGLPMNPCVTANKHDPSSHALNCAALRTYPLSSSSPALTIPRLELPPCRARAPASLTLYRREPLQPLCRRFFPLFISFPVPLLLPCGAAPHAALAPRGNPPAVLPLSSCLLLVAVSNQ